VTVCSTAFAPADSDPVTTTTLESDWREKVTLETPRSDEAVVPRTSGST